MFGPSRLLDFFEIEKVVLRHNRMGVAGLRNLRDDLASKAAFKHAQMRQKEQWLHPDEPDDEEPWRPKVVTAEGAAKVAQRENVLDVFRDRLVNAALRWEDVEEDLAQTALGFHAPPSEEATLPPA